MKLIKNYLYSLLNTYIGLPKEIYFLFIGKFINCIGSFVYPLLSLILTQKIGLSISNASIFITFTAIIQAPCILLGGKLIDSIGRKKVILIFQGIAAIAFIIASFLKPSNTLAIFIIIASCFSCIANPAYDSMVADITTPENRKASFSLIYMGLNLGFSIGPLIGGLLFEHYLNLVFVFDALTTLASITLIGYFLNETHPNLNNKSIKTNSFKKETNQSVLKVFIKIPILIYYSLLMIIFQFVYSQWSFAIPIQLAEIFGTKSAYYFGILGSCNGLIVLIFTPIITVLTKNYKILSIISTGGFLYAISFGACGFISKFTSFIIIIIIMTLGEIAIVTNSGTFIANLTPASHRGRVNSIIPLISGIGYSLGPIIMGKSINHFGINYSWIFIGIIATIGSLFMYLLNYVKLNDNMH